MYNEILYDVKEPVATITFNRPDKLNAFTYTMLDEVRHALAQAEQDDRVIGIIITGSGRGFSAGMDMQSLGETAAAGQTVSGPPKLESDPGDKRMGPEFDVGYGFLLSIRKPILAAVNGPCAGLGFSIAMFCDLRFASEKAMFTTSFAQRGLVAEHGVSWILPRLIGSARALDILWSSRKVDSAEAERLGLVSRVVAPEQLPARSSQLLRAARRELLADLAHGDEAAGVPAHDAAPRRLHARDEPLDGRELEETGLHGGREVVRRASEAQVREVELETDIVIDTTIRDGSLGRRGVPLMRST